MKKNNLSATYINPVTVLIIAGLIIRLLLYLIFQPWLHTGEILQDDAGGYHRLAEQFLNNGSFRIPGSDLDTFRTPGYPLFIAFVYLITGIKPFMVLLVQVFIGLASVYLIYLEGKNMFNVETGFVSALLLMLEPDHTYYTYSLLSETLFVSLLLLSWLSLIYFLKKNKLLFLIISSFVTGIAIYVRPVALLFPAVIIFVLIFHKIRESGILRCIEYSLIIILVTIIIVSPWLYRNYKIYGYPRLTSMQGYNLLNFNAAYAIKNSHDRPVEDIRKELDSLVMARVFTDETFNPFRKSDIESEIAYESIRANRQGFLKAQITGMINLYISMDFKPFMYRFFRIKDITSGKKESFDNLSFNALRFKSLPAPLKVAGLFYALVLLFYYFTALWGCIKLVREKKFVLLASIIAVILYFTVLTGVVGMARYKLPISPFYILLSGYAVQSFLNKKRKTSTATFKF